MHSTMSFHTVCIKFYTIIQNTNEFNFGIPVSAGTTVQYVVVVVQAELAVKSRSSSSLKELSTQIITFNNQQRTGKGADSEPL